MFTQLPKLMSRAGAAVLPILLCTLACSLDATAQTPLAVASNAVAVPHTGKFKNLWQSAVSTRGDFVTYDFGTDTLYEFPANGGPAIVIIASGVLGNGFNNSGIAIDPRNNNIYLDDNYNNGLLFIPYDAVTNAWDLGYTQVATSLAGNLGGTCGNYFQSAGLAMNANGILAVATENGCGVEIFTVPVDLNGNFGAAVPIVSNMTKRARTVAIDNAGNIYFSEDIGSPTAPITPTSPAGPGAMFIPAGTTNLASDTTVAHIDLNPGTTSNVQGVTVDATGNIYIADGTVGTYVVPLQAGVPNPKQAVFVSTIPAAGGPSIDTARGTLFYQIGTAGSISDIVKIYINRTEFGSVPAGSTSGVSGTVNFVFSASATPYTFSIQQDGVAGVFTLGSLSGCGITYTTSTASPPVTTENTTAYSAQSAAVDAKGNIYVAGAASATCSVPVTFTPTAVGKATATLLMQDQKGNILSSSLLHGSGTGPVILGLAGTEAAIGSGFKTPGQIAVDYAGNTYVADSGLGKVLEYPQGSTPTTVPTSLGKGLISPTGVAVDGSGNLYVADSGNIYEIPFGPGSPAVVGPPAIAAVPAGPVTANQITLKTKLGAGVKLAADGIGDVFAADPANQRYVRLRQLLGTVQEIDYTGYTQLTAIASDGAGDVFLANGQNLIEITSTGPQTILNSLSNATSLAVDHSGSIYVTSPTQTLRIPNIGGTLNAASQSVIAAAATKPASVAVDAAGNAYVADSAAEDVDFLSTNAFANLGKLATTTSMSTASVSLVNSGNLPLTVTGFGNTADYTVTSNSCVGTPVAVGAACSATITFNPGPGDQGTLATQLAVKSTAINTATGINVTGVGVTLANSATTITVSKPSVTSAPVVVTVAPVTGTSPVPTGNVTVTVTGTGLTPVVLTQPLVGGTVTINETAIPAGSLTFTVLYSGDRVYGTSTATVTTTVAAGTVTLVQPPAATVPIYVLAAGAGAQEPYDASQVPYYYNYPVTVKASNSAPLVGLPILNSAGAQSGMNYGQVTYQLAGGTTPACLGTAAIINVGADGTAPFPTSCFAINTSNNQIPNLSTSYTFSPVYTDPNYGTVTGTPVTVIALRNPSVLLAAASPSLSVAAGSSVSTNITVTSLLGYGVTGVNSNLNNYSLPVELGCDALPAHTSCTFAYPTPDPSDSNSVAVNPTTPGKVVMTLNTNVAVGTSSASISHTSGGYLAAVFGFGALGLAFRRRKSLRGIMLTALALLVGISATLGMSACSSANISATPTLTTPKGAYTVTVTAKQAGSKQVPNPVSGGAPITVYGSGNQMSIPYTVSVTIQ